jgi:predicted NBD/HSP70 family sugar kinase
VGSNATLRYPNQNGHLVTTPEANPKDRHWSNPTTSRRSQPPKAAEADVWPHLLFARQRRLERIRYVEAEMARHRLNSDRGSLRLRKVLVVDVGGTSVKVLATGQRRRRKIPSAPDMTAQAMVEKVQRLADGWSYEVVSIGYPGPVVNDHPTADPKNLGKGWVGFDFEKAFGCPVKMINDAAMQALGSYDEAGRMLFLGFGTGLGSALIADGVLVPMELAHLVFKGRTYGDYVGLRGRNRHGKKKWRRHVAKVVGALRHALQADYVVLGGGNAKKLKRLPEAARLGHNKNAFIGGFRLWEQAWEDERPACIVRRGTEARPAHDGRLSSTRIG